MEIRVGHELGREPALERLRRAAEKLGLELEAEPGAFDGLVRRTLPFGVIESSFAVSEQEVRVTLLRKPAVIPEGAVRRLVEDGLRQELAS